ncbi:MAG: hypothetical protein JSW00_03615 [Thermoplasmata archaeon]|nr:MAG: hypothetical protein JSW00_03615 [Thermoplasmata archaeon]
MVRKYYVAILVLAVLIISALSGCFEEEGDTVTKSVKGEYFADENTHLKVYNVNGKVIVSGYDGGNVTLDAQKKVPRKHKSELNEVEINVTEGTNEIKIKTIVEDIHANHVTVNMEIMVPYYVIVDTVQNTNGDIEISDTLGNTSVGNTNGNIIINDVSGYVSANSANGVVEVRGTTGIGSVGTTNGNIYVQIFDINFDVDITSTNGNIDVYILTSMQVSIELRTTNGKISVKDVPLTYTKEEDTHKIGDLGSGGFKINIVTSNGNVNLNKLSA